ncbi:MAG TPA: hypothetical protein VF702_03125 [Allosphingosinicella sp.]
MSRSLRGEALYGMGWYARRNGDRAILSLPTGMWDTGDELHPISIAEFHRLREEPDSIREVRRRCEQGPYDEGWWAAREGKCIVYLRRDRFPDERPFEIPFSAFERLGEAEAFDEIYREYRANHV